MRAGAPLLGNGVIVGLALGASLMWAFQLREPGHHWYDTFVEHAPEWAVAFFTLTLTGSTIYLWRSTAALARDATLSTQRLLKAESPYVTGGGDFDGKTGFRLDVENHGKTPAFMTGYDLQFAKLADLQQEELQGKEPRRVRPQHFRHIDGISPQGGRKQIFTKIPIPKDADVVFGAVWYDDPILGGEHHSRFILRINSTRDIPGHGLTRLDVDGVNRKYWDWDYRENLPDQRARRCWLCQSNKVVAEKISASCHRPSAAS